MNITQRFDRYLEHLSAGLGHADRYAGLRDYCTGLMLPLSRKNVRPMAAQIDPLRISARHQALHHFVAKARWSDTEMLRRVAQWVVPQMDLRAGGWWIVGDTSFPKQGSHSVGVAPQYCKQLGKRANCQVAVSISLATDQGSLPVAWQLYLPEDWAHDPARRAKAGIPEPVRFSTKTQIALQQLRRLRAEGAPCYCVLADSDCGVNDAFRQALDDMGLPYMVGAASDTAVRPHNTGLLRPKAQRGNGRNGRSPAVPQRSAAYPPISARTLAMALPPQAFHSVTWREDDRAPQRGRFAAVRVGRADGNVGKTRLPNEQWLLVEWPSHETEPDRYWLSTLDKDTSLQKLVHAAHLCWRIERDHQDLQRNFGLDHYEGRNWQGFHHHAVLSVAAYGFMMAERLIAGNPKRTNMPRPKPLACSR